MTAPWTASNTPCPASAAATIQSDDRKPQTAATANTVPTSTSSRRTWVEAPMAANSAYRYAMTMAATG